MIIEPHIEYLTSFYSKYPDQFKKVMRDFMASSDSESRMALGFIMRSLNQNLMKDILSGFHDGERVHLQDLLTKNDYAPSTGLLGIIRSKLTSSLIGHRPEMDSEILELTLKLKVGDVFTFCNSNSEVAGSLLNLLEPKFLSKVLDLLPLEQSRELMEVALKAELRTDSMVNLKHALKNFLLNDKNNTFSSKIYKALSLLDPSKELIVYKNLLKTTNLDELIETATQNVPFLLLANAPEQIQREILQLYPLNKKAQLISCLEGDQKNKFVEASALPGSSARQMLDMEIDRIQQSPLEFKRMQVQRSIIIQDFVQFSRSFLASNPDSQVEMRLSAREWLTKIADQSNGPKLVGA